MSISANTITLKNFLMKLIVEFAQLFVWVILGLYIWFLWDYYHNRDKY